MRIKLKKKPRKSHKMYGRKYRGYGQIGRHRHHPGGKGRVGVKDHMKTKLLKEGYEYGSGNGFVSHGIKYDWQVINVGLIDELVKAGKMEYREERGVRVVDLSDRKFVKILGSGKVTIPLKIILNSKAKISHLAKEKIESAGGIIEVAS